MTSHPNQMGNPSLLPTLACMESDMFLVMWPMHTHIIVFGTSQSFKIVTVQQQPGIGEECLAEMIATRAPA